MRTKNLLYSWFLIMLFCMMGTSSAWADETYTIGWGTASGTASTNFDAISGSVDGILSFSAERNSSSTIPAYNSSSSELRLYYNSGGNGGSITLTPAEGVTITGFVMKTSTAPTVGYSVDGGDAISISASSNTYTVSDISASSSLKIQNVNTSNTQLRIKTIEITYTTGGGGGGGSSAVATTTTIDATGITNTDIYSGTAAGSLSATVVDADDNAVEGATVTWSGNNDEVATIDASTGVVTLVAAGTVTFTATYAGVTDEYKASSDTYELTVTDSTPIPTHTATFSVNGVTSTQDFEEGADIIFPADPADVSGKTFVGWVAEAIEGTTNDAPTFVTSATMGQSDITYYAVFAYASGSGSSEVVDELNRTWTEATGSSYIDWSDKTATSSAVYAGNSAGGNSSIQLRSNNNNSGIVTTTSGGKVKKVVISWNSNTASGRTVNVYGKNSAYSNAGDLYNSSSQGDLLGTIVYGTSTELTIDSDYEYVGLRSAGSALYLDEVSITWSTGSGASYSDYCTTVVAAAVERPTIEVAANPFTFSTTATITCETEGAAIKYSFDGENWNDYEDALTITETTTLSAKAVKEEAESTVASVEITKNLAVPTVAIDATGITNTNVFDGTEAGSLAASVTYNEAAVEGAAITWSGDNDAVATIDDATGAVTLVAAGTVTFTATYAGNSDYAEKTATYQMTVTNSDPNGPGTENNPYTVAQAIAATPASGTSANVYIRGIVSAFYNTSIVGDGSNYRYYISDDGTTDSQLLIYKGKGLDNVDFSDADDLLIGDEIVIYGKLTTYSNAPEVASGNYIVSLNRAAEKHALNFAVSPADAGTIEGLDGEANEVNSGDKFDENATITLSATANTGYTFTNWTAEGFEINGEDAVKTDLDITMPANDVTLTANFSVNTYALDITSTNGTVAVIVNGEVWNGSDAIAYGSTVELTATPNENWAFSSWTAEGINFEDATLNPISFTMPANEVMIEANYADASATYTVIYVVNGVDNSVERKHGDPLNLDAPMLPATTPETTMIFAGWSTSDDLANPTIMANDAPVTSDLIVYAMFTARQGQTVYQKVTEGPVEDGEYLIVYETEDVAFDGSLTTLDAGANIISLEEERISDETIASTTTTNASAFTIAALEEGYSIQSQSGYYIGQTSNANGMATSEETVYTNTISIDSNGDADIVSGGAYLRYNSASNQTRFRYYKSSSYGGQKAIQLYKKVTTTNLYTFGETEDITVSAAGYATYCSDKALDFSHTPDLKAYIVTSDGSETNYTEVTTAPANTGLLLKGIKGETTNFTAYVIGNSDTKTADNKLVGVNENTHIDATTEGKTNFVLQNQVKYGVGFYKVTSEGFNVRANSAYLSVELSSGSEARSFFALPEAGSETTGINSIDNGQLTIDNEAVYDLQGRKVQNPKRGLYIMNGKKVMVK